jgi:hypothetical protein
MRTLRAALARILDDLLVCEGARSGAASGPLHVLPRTGEAGGLPEGASAQVRDVSWGAQMSPAHGSLCAVLPESFTGWREVNILADFDLARVAG